MRLIAAVAALSGLLCLPLNAAPVSDSPPPGKTEGITVARAIALRNAIIMATGVHDKIVGQGASQSVARVLYEIEPTARWALNDDLNALTAVLSGFDKTLNEMRQKLIADNGGQPLPEKAEDQTPEQKKLLRQFNDDYLARLNATRDVAALFHVRRGDFKEPLPGEIVAPMQEAGIIDP